MSEHDRDLASMDQDQTQRHLRAQARIQEAIAEVVPDAPQLTHAEVVTRLKQALEARGIGPQPRGWLDSVAAEAREGRTYVEDTSGAGDVG